MASSGFYTYAEATGLITPNTQNLMAEVQQEYSSAFGSSLVLAPNTPQGILITAETLARTRVLQLNSTVANQINPNYAGGVFLDSILALTGSERTASLYTLVPVNLTGVAGTIVPAGSFVQDVIGNMYATLTTVTLTTGIVTLVVQAVASGPITVAVGTVTIIVTNTLGWETVTNTSVQTFTGNTTQSDVAARTLRQNTLALQGQSLSQAITSGVSAVPGVTSFFYQQNDVGSTQTINDVVMKPSSLYLCVDGGDPTAIAQVLNQKKSGGCDYNNASTYTGTATLIGSSVTLSGTISNASAIVTGISSTTNLSTSMLVQGVNIPANTTIVSVDSGTQVTLSANATASTTELIEFSNLISCTLTGPFTVSSCTTTVGSKVITTVSSTTGVFIGQTVNGLGIVPGSVVISFVANTSVTISIAATSSASTTTVTFGASQVITVPDTTYMFPGQTIMGSGLSAGTFVTSIINSTTITINSFPTTTGSGIMLVFGNTPFIIGLTGTPTLYVGGGVSGPYIPNGSVIIQKMSSTAIRISNLLTGFSSSETINVYGGAPQDIQITDPYSGQTVDVLFDNPSYVPIAVQVMVVTNSVIVDIVGTIQQAILDYATGNIAGDPGLKIGTDVSCFAIAGAISLRAPSIYVSSVKTSIFPISSYSSDSIPIEVFQRATIQLSGISVLLT